MRNTLAIFFLLASIAGAQTLESWTVDTDKAVPRPLVIRRGETRDLRVTFKNYSQTAAIPTNADVQLWYRSADMSNGFYSVVTGSVHSASAGVARVLWTAANCGAATNYTWDLVVLSNTTPYNLRAFGTIQLQAGVYSQATTATNPATYLALDWAHIINLNTNSAPFMTVEGVVTNGGCTVDGQAISNGAVIVTSGGGGGVSGATVTNIVGGIMATGACATAATVTGPQSNRIEMALTNAAEFYPASNPSYYQTAAQVQGAAATVAGNVFTSFIGNPYSYRGSFTGHVLATSGNVLTNAADFATAAQGSKADTALQPAATNGWEVGTHTNLATLAQGIAGTNAQARVAVLETNAVTKGMTNGWVTSSHSGLATNAGGAGAGYFAMSNGAWTAFAPGAGGTATTVTGPQSNTIATALQPADTNGWVVSSHTALVQINDARYLASVTNETDPVWGAVSNTVRAGAAAGATALQPTGSGSGLTNITAAQVGAVSNTAAGIAAAGGVVTNQEDVTLGGLQLYSLMAERIIRNTGTWGVLKDSEGQSALVWGSGGRFLYDIYGNYSASFGNGFSVGPDLGTNVNVYITLTNHTEQIAGKLSANGSGSGLTNITAAQVGAVSNTAEGIAAAGGVTGGVFSVGTSISNVVGKLYIPTNGFTTAEQLAAATNTLGVGLTNQLNIATNALGNSLTNTIRAATNTLWQGTTNQLTLATNTLWRATTNQINVATNTIGINLTNRLNIATNAVWVQTTNVSYYSAAPLAYKVTLNNTSAMTWTNTYSPWSNCASVEALSTGVITHLYIWPTNASCSMEFLWTATGTPVNVFPSGAIWVTGGVFSATAGTIGKSNLVVVKHTPYLYMMFALTNAQTSSWGTP